MRLDQILALGEQLQVNKHDYLLKEGSKADRLFFVDKGLIRAFYLKDGKEVTDWFGTAGTFITSIQGYYGNQHSTQYLEALENSSIYTIRKTVVEQACQRDPLLEQSYREVITQHLMRLQERITALQFYTAKERYDLLLKKNPYVVQRAPRTHIASYLGISLETLSRLKQ
ncbi:MAG TPA: Crp/Fnr family transcriptional regulator [Microscillaceae bacterium]|nr:Crp/Fnr family transcriptional regulator [Microscillaceae bacterium]